MNTQVNSAVLEAIIAADSRQPLGTLANVIVVKEGN